MKHLKSTSTRATRLPASASQLETQQKIATFASFAAALGAFGEAIGIFQDLGDSE